MRIQETKLENDRRGHSMPALLLEIKKGGGEGRKKERKFRDEPGMSCPQRESSFSDR